MLSVCRKSLKDTMCYSNIPILTYKIYYPYIISTCCSSFQDEVNSFYFNQAKQSEDYCRTVLFQMAQENAQNTNNVPFNNYEFIVDFTVTYNNCCIISLYMDTYSYTGGAHGNTIRTSNTWDFRTCTLLQLNDIYSLTSASLLALENSIEQQITDRLIENPGIYFENYPSLLRENFNVNNFYLKPCKGVIYYQQYDIAPYSTGIPQFYFPIKNIG
jgi:hypothetical protein